MIEEESNMITVKFTPEQHHDLKAFLSRVDLKGREVPAFLEIMKAIEKGVIEDGE
jgi:hypothetical protein